MNHELALHVIEQALQYGIKEFCVAPGARNAAFVYLLAQISTIKVYYWSEERSAAFFAVGRIKATYQPIAVVTTSGTAVAELLPATIEAYYTSLPLLLITADRPRRFRLSGAPQSIEQVGIFSCYTILEKDLAENEFFQLDQWSGRGPCHLNVCFEEPSKNDNLECARSFSRGIFTPKPILCDDSHLLDEFIQKCQFPLVIVGALNQNETTPILSFLRHLKAPVYLEAQSGLRENVLLENLRIESIEDAWNCSSQHGYPIDGILRIGGIPTARLWRDLEETNNVKVCSVSENPFAGLTNGNIIHTSLREFFKNYKLSSKPIYSFQAWKNANRSYQLKLLKLFEEEPLAELSLFHLLSKKISEESKIYVGNSLPIREWDQAADWTNKRFQVFANRGANGIEGQLSTFLGLASPEQNNWAILGDLTTLYDMIAPWVIHQIQPLKVNVVVVNNSGGQIFAPKFAHPSFLNSHQLNFKAFADFWGWEYDCWHEIPTTILGSQTSRLIELVPDPSATDRLRKKMQRL
ncbi:2-succinyl-5-enolpyruvyl-6-hydroxy-3-cyclohexene-1-carboxylic-acid synthase [Candidatus Protochlamydia sp. W-9]|uniref:2-succinyl-5-enolpyruvyl-6-hydroxy-3- cyclohexene-1-carboxylic-acid synthase n=1 Tax=Candidatus Protochlamydia sp. W-9 TaxID=1785087 RepID=UPI00096AADCF|nr:2-succinyl-5-enolpyruvyl-6-hydroxy-3-cyclohexene-1-carboxylic-acid synthase [Candidatus Protochlamydia sp. W-9]